MPLLQSTFPGAPWYQPEGHTQTIFPNLFRQVKLTYQRERFILSDGDFVDLDWHKMGNKQLCLLTHGLEGNSDRPYVKGMANFFAARGWDILAWNCRSCSGEINRAFRLYHHGEIGDLTQVIDYTLEQGYEQLVLIGFSMGGNITMKYLGVTGDQVPEQVLTGIAISSPCDLKASIRAVERPENWMYQRKFMRALKEKVRQKDAQFPGLLDLSLLPDIKRWIDFDRAYSVPLTGYRDTDEFYYEATAKNFMPGIKRPVLLINALNDPMLEDDCYPVDLCQSHPHIHLELPKTGGHVGFAQKGSPENWAEIRTWAWVAKVLRESGLT